jgi:integrase
MRQAREAAPEMVTWTAEELGTFLAWVQDNHYGPAFTFLATTGMRRGEALGLTWEDINLKAGSVAVRRARIAIEYKASLGKTKSGRAREVELDTRTVSVLRGQKARQAKERLLLGPGYSEDNFVFSLPDGRGFHPERFSREFERKQATYNRLHPTAPLPRLTLHGLRHTWATLALNAGEHPKVVAERLGHSSIAVTLNVYSHVTKPMASKAAENVADMIFGA